MQTHFLLTVDEAEQSEADEPKSGRGMLYGILILLFLVLLVVFGWYWAGREKSAPVQPPAPAETVKKNTTNAKRQKNSQSKLPRTIETDAVKKVGNNEYAGLKKVIIRNIVNQKDSAAGEKNGNENGLEESSAEGSGDSRPIKKKS